MIEGPIISGVTTYIAVLRAVNVGGRSPVSMAALRDFAEALGFARPQTLLQSGNLVFQAPRAVPASLERLLETEASARLGLDTEFMVRTAGEWDRVIAGNPFPAEAVSDPSHLLVMALKSPVKAGAVAAVQASIKGREVVRGEGAQLYLVYPDGIGRSRLTSAIIEKATATRGTARNWNTVLKLAALAGGR